MALSPSKRFTQVKDFHLKNGTLFEDPEFLPQIESIDCKNPGKYANRHIEWKRPGELFKEPAMFKDGITQLDICQGMLGDCWLLASMASLASRESLFYQVVPQDQGFQKGDYCGAFRFCFWRFGEWKEVIIDDRLPTYNGKLMFVHSPENGEMWCSLMEKAYAKLFKSYVYLKGGQIGEALTDFTGGIAENIDLKKAPDNLYRKLLKANARQFLMGCAINAKPNEIEAKLNNGLVKGHAYSVTSIATIKTRDGDFQLIRVRNPWGNEREWTGAWSDKSREWALVSDTEKRQIGLTYDYDGEFWMSFSDFCKEFDVITICHNAGTDLDANKDLTVSSREGSWVINATAGGCRNYLNTYASNPQFKVVLKDTDDDDSDLCSLTVALMQKESRGFSSPALTIGWAIYTIPEDAEKYIQDGRYDRDFFAYHTSTARSSTFINAREIVQTLELPPGEYMLIPSTFEPNYKGDFFLRLMTEKPTNETTELRGQTSATGKDARSDSYSDYENEDPAVIQKFQRTFDALAGADEQISPSELLSMLEVICRGEGFKANMADACAAVNLFDKDNTGTIDFNEFLKFYRFFSVCKRTFASYAEGERLKDGHRLDSALKKMDAQISRALLATVVQRYGGHGLTVCDFMTVTCKVKAVVGSIEGEGSPACPNQVRETFLMLALKL